MPKSTNQKRKLLCLMQILLEQTDEDHFLPLALSLIHISNSNAWRNVLLDFRRSVRALQSKQAVSSPFTVIVRITEPPLAAAARSCLLYTSSFSSVIPITLIVLLLSTTAAPMNLETLMLFLTGAVLLVIGMGFFTLGADMAMMPIGQQAGEQLTRTKKRCV